MRGLEKGSTQDHRPNIFRSGRLKEIGTTASAVTNIIANEVSNYGWIAWIVFGNTRLHFPHQIGSDIGGLGVDATTELGEEGDEARAKTEANNKRGDQFWMGGETIEQHTEYPEAKERKR